MKILIRDLVTTILVVSVLVGWDYYLSNGL